MANQGSHRRRDNLVEALLSACRADPHVARGGVVVVAFSGGPDSSAMLHALVRASAALRLQLHAVHVNHGLRPGSSGDADHAARFASDLGVPIEVVRVAPRGRGEEAARRARHAALEAVATRYGAHSIALGHTAGDQAETVLLHLLRGSGILGLAAMAPRDRLRFRPLLEISRQQVDSYCARHRLDPVLDESNSDPSFTRNRVRHELIPMLETRFNPRVQEALVRLARIARDEHDVVCRTADEWLVRHGGAVPRAAYRALPRAVQAEILRQAWTDASGSGCALGGASGIDQALRLARGNASGMIQLGVGFELHADDQELQVRPSERPARRRRTPARLLTEP